MHNNHVMGQPCIKYVKNTPRKKGAFSHKKKQDKRQQFNFTDLVNIDIVFNSLIFCVMNMIRLNQRLFLK